jgi:glucose/arabinose dehydrogenase
METRPEPHPRAVASRLTTVSLALISLGALVSASASAYRSRHILDAPPAVELVTLAGELGPITSIANAGDSRLFLTIQTGAIRIWDGSKILPDPFLDLTALVSCCGERGLLSVAFSPGFAENGRFFVYYTDASGNLVIARYRAPAPPQNEADPGSGVVLLTILHPTNANHNGGELQFGPDGYLYVGVGDGGSANDPPCNAQRGDVLLGKLLRLDVDSHADAAPFYSIPPDNPFVSSSDGIRDEIWARGLRNPWRFSFDRVTGDLWIGDVGQDEREEVDFQARGSAGGQNYGWKIMEGTRCGDGGSSNCPPGVPACGDPSLVRPVFEYSHDAGDCSITGGYVYRGNLVPQLSGTYLYGDYCTGRMWAGSVEIAPRWPGLTTFGQDAGGELYVGSAGGTFARVANPNPSPTPGRLVPARLDRTPPPLRVVTRGPGE